jgi:hypothetical protein
VAFKPVQNPTETCFDNSKEYCKKNERKVAKNGKEGGENVSNPNEANCHLQ